MLKSLKTVWVNQIAAQIKLTEMWKAHNDSTKSKIKIEDVTKTRIMTRGDFIKSGSTNKFQKVFSSTRL